MFNIMKESALFTYKESTDQPAFSHSLTKDFVTHLQKQCIMLTKKENPDNTVDMQSDLALPCSHMASGPLFVLCITKL